MGIRVTKALYESMVFSLFLHPSCMILAQGIRATTPKSVNLIWGLGSGVQCRNPRLKAPQGVLDFSEKFRHNSRGYGWLHPGETFVLGG